MATRGHCRAVLQHWGSAQGLQNQAAVREPQPFYLVALITTWNRTLNSLVCPFTVLYLSSSQGNSGLGYLVHVAPILGA